MHQQWDIEIACYRERLRHPDRLQRCEIGDAGIDEEALEAENASLAKLAHLTQIARNRSTPKADIHVTLAARCGALRLECVKADGGRHAVDRHVDQGCNTPGGRGFGRGRETLPVGVARLADMDV